MPSITGLTAAEVEARRAAGQTNQPPKSQTKTTGEIVRDNVCTYFNLVFLVLAAMLALVHSWLNMGFLGIVFWNTLIGIVQQLRAKRTIDKLTLVSAQKLRCLRDGRWCEVLSDDLVRYIHKMAMTVDMSDESFSGNITGVALEMKFMPMSFLTKTKIRNMDEGLKRRFELYNNWLCKKGVMQPVSKNDVDVIFTVDMPSNLTETVDIVQKLEGRVDEQTLLAQLPFVKDPVEMAEIMKKQKEENKKQLMDSFGKSNPLESKDEKPDEGVKPSGEA